MDSTDKKKYFLNLRYGRRHNNAGNDYILMSMMPQSVVKLLRGVKLPRASFVATCVRRYSLPITCCVMNHHKDGTFHYCDVIMGAMASQITILTIVYSFIHSGADQRSKSKFRVTVLCVGNSLVTDEFPAQMSSNAENVPVWWRHYVMRIWPIDPSGPFY